MKVESPMLTVSEVAELLRVHQMTVYRLIRNGALSPVKVGRVWRFDRRQVAVLLTGEVAHPEPPLDGRGRRHRTSEAASSEPVHRA